MKNKKYLWTAVLITTVVLALLLAGCSPRTELTYRVTGTVLAVGQSPKTEYVWFDTEARQKDGALVGGMRMQLRWMKASSDLYGSAE